MHAVTFPPTGQSAILALLADDPREGRFLGVGLGIAAALHAIAFLFIWPQVSTPATAASQRVLLRVVVQPLTPPPPPQTLPEERPAPARRVQIPDPDPLSPEPLARPVDQTNPPIDEQFVPPDVAVVPPPPMADGPSVVEVGVHVKPPVQILRVDPTYTDAALKVGVQGAVVLELTIDTHGAVSDVLVLRPLPLGLTERAVEAARQWRFEPSTLNGRPVSVIYRLTVVFRIDRG